VGAVGVADKSAVVADSHIQSSRPRKDGATTLKRRRVRSGTKLTKSKPSAGNQPRAGRGQLDYTGCVTEEDMQKRIDDYWAPPELGLMKRSENTKPERRPESTPDEECTSDDLNRQPSHRSVSSNYGERISQRLPRASESRASSSSLPAIHRSHTVDSRNRHRTPLKNNGASLEERMNTLLLSTDDEKVPGFLTPSDYMTEKRLKQAKERKQKEREAAIRAAKELRLIRRQPLKPLVESMGSRWEGRVDEARYKSAQEVITTSIGGTELRLKDFQTLLGRAAWLNDEIINSYIEWIVDAANRVAADAPLVYGESANKAPKFIAHNSFFYENLVKKGPSSTERLMKRKKAAGTALLEVDSVFVPICKGAHWTVGVVRPVARTIEYFDSMGGSGHQFTDLMRKWLAFQLGDAYIEEEWKVPRTACAHQSNGYDCGVFVCTNAFCVALGLDTSCYTERDMTQQRRNIAAVLINRGFTGDFDFARRAL
jgi:sentrin-specific protease 1